MKVSWVSTSAQLSHFKITTPVKKCLYTVADLEGLGIVSQILKSDIGLSCPEWINFLGSMGNLLKIARPIGEIDSHAKLALSAAEVAFELFMKQQERDERVRGLIQLMANLYGMILDSDPLDKCQTLSQSINDLISLTRECAYFVAEYMKTGPFSQRVVMNAIFNVNDTITQFEKKFLTLKEVFFTGIMLSIGQVNVRVLEQLKQMDDKLDQIVEMISLPVLGRSWNKLDGCLEGTQDQLLSDIYKWGTSVRNDVPNVFLLLGGSRSFGGNYIF
ncbi:hypothetical protein BDQ17DRAFT_1436640 [Cyathus striatus]|nr:hypothetical protein BDQ17DRAFT_1436640 [Cyathus striatus]